MKTPFLFLIPLCVFLGSAPAADETLDLTGSWNATAEHPNDEVSKAILSFSRDADHQWTGNVQSDDWEKALSSVTVDGKSVALELELSRDDTEMRIRVTATEKEPGRLVGRWNATSIEDDEEFVSGPWKAERLEPLDLTGKWDVTAKLSEERELESVYTFEQNGEKITGYAETDDRRLDFEKVTLDGKEVSIAMKTEFEGNPIEIQIRANAESPDKLVGRWVVPGENDDDEEAAGGDWVALRLGDSEAPQEEKTNADILGDWNLLVKFGETETDYVLVVKEGEGANLTGTLISPRSGEHAFDSVAFSPAENTIDMKITRAYEGNPFALRYTGKLSPENKLAGEVSVVGNDAFKGTWSGERKAEDKGAEEESDSNE